MLQRERTILNTDFGGRQCQILKRYKIRGGICNGITKSPCILRVIHALATHFLTDQQVFEFDHGQIL
jgi:hypothetical protein